MIQVSIGSVLLGHLLLGIYCFGEETCEAIIPSDSTVKLGQPAVLKCRQTTQNIAWTFCPRNSGPQLIASNCNLSPKAADSYRLDKSNNGCNLVIDNVTMNHYGTYTCQDLSLNDAGHSVQLGNSNENFALNKNAIQSSTDVAQPFGPKTGLANNAVDGNADSNYQHGSCTLVLLTVPAWWAVDLGQETSVGRVRITNIAEPYSERLKNFFIGLTNVSPWTAAPPKLDQSSLCKYYAGYLPGGVPIDIYCEPHTKPGRYLFVMLNKVDYLNICELEAYYE